MAKELAFEAGQQDSIAQVHLDLIDRLAMLVHVVACKERGNERLHCGAADLEMIRYATRDVAFSDVTSTHLGPA